MQGRSGRTPGLARWWVALIIKLFPGHIKREYGADLLNAFEDQLDAAGASRRTWIGTWSAKAWTTTKVSWQILMAAIAERNSVEPKQQRIRDQRKEPMLSNIKSDLKYALRGFLKQPGFTAVAVLTLALGIGACAAIFSVVNGILLNPLPYQNPDRLVSIRVNSGIDPDGGFYGTSEPEYWDFSTLTSSLAEVGAMSGAEVTMGDSTGVRRIRVARTTATMLPMLGVNPLMGRFFNPDEDQPGSSGAIVLSYGLWQTEFGGDPNVLERTLTFDVLDQPLPVVGVMPAGFEFPDESWEAWVPLSLNRENPWARNNHYLSVVARLAPQVSLDEARNEMNVLAARSTADYPDYYPNSGYQIQLEGYHDRIIGNVVTPLYVLLGAVGFVVLMACVNVANLLLARGEARKREIAIRNAVGASGKRLTSQLITENFLLAGVGGVGGLAVAFAGLKTLLALAPSGIPRLAHVGIDVNVLGFSLGIAIATGLMFGVVPALQAARADVHEVMKEGGGSRGATRSSHTLRRVLVATQVTLAVVLASGAGLMLRSVANMYRVDTGFTTENVVTMRLNPSVAKYDSGELVTRFYDDLLDRVRAIPGVASAGAVFALPLASGTNNWSILIEGNEAATIGDAPAARVQICTPDYFETLGLTLLRGRLFDEHDVADSPPVVIISETMARTHWPNEDPLGKRMKVWDSRWPWLEVVGVVKDVRQRAVDQEPRTWWYVPHAQSYATAYFSPRDMFLTVSSATDPEMLVAALRNAISSYDASVPISNVQTMKQVFARSISSDRFVTVLLVAFGVLALFLATVGVYGVISYAVSQRTHEIGLRMALGAPASTVLARVVREGLLVSATGIVLGVAGSLVLSKSFQSLVYGITPTDPFTYVGVVGVLLAASVGASLAPARRACRVDPMAALRVEN